MDSIKTHSSYGVEAAKFNNEMVVVCKKASTEFTILARYKHFSSYTVAIISVTYYDKAKIYTDKNWREPESKVDISVQKCSSLYLLLFVKLCNCVTFAFI